MLRAVFKKKTKKNGTRKMWSEQTLRSHFPFEWTDEDNEFALISRCVSVLRNKDLIILWMYANESSRQYEFSIAAAAASVSAI